MRRHAEQGEDLGGRPGIALPHEQRRARARRAQRGRRLHDLHAVGALQRKADVGGHQHLERVVSLGIRHGFCSTHWMWPIITSWAKGVFSRARRTRAGQDAAEEPGHVAVLADHAEPGTLDPGPEAAHGDGLEDVVLLLLALLGQRDEGVGLLRLLQRPGRVAGQPAEGRERRAAPDEQVQRDGDEQARKVGPRQRQRGRGREVEDAARPQHAEALAQVVLGGGDVLDHGMAEHEVEGGRAEGEPRGVALHEGGVGDRLSLPPAASPIRGSAPRGRDRRRRPIPRPAKARSRPRRSPRRARGRGGSRPLSPEPAAPWRCGGTRTPRSRIRCGSGRRRLRSAPPRRWSSRGEGLGVEPEVAVGHAVHTEPLGDTARRLLARPARCGQASE